MPTDIEIAHSVKPLPITQVAQEAGIDESYLTPYGFDKAKVDYALLNSPEHADSISSSALVLVTAINPTPAGEGKTTTTIGLADGLRRRGVKSAVALREPSLGPVFGVKGGAAGGGYAQVIPMEDINLHFTGDFHAIGAANNLLAAMLDNHIQQGNKLGIDVKRVTWKRVVDMNDRQLRHVIDGIGGKAQGVPREDGFDITVASEVMAILCLATSIADLKQRLGEIVVAYTYEGKPVTASDLKAQGAMAALLKDALKPNLVQTLEHTPAFVHGGPFANIAHGCNSVMATRMALCFGDIAITEAGFGADLGAEKFFDIKCRMTGLYPRAVVVVATARALKYNGGVAKANLNEENLDALALACPTCSVTYRTSRMSLASRQLSPSTISRPILKPSSRSSRTNVPRAASVFPSLMPGLLVAKVRLILQIRLLRLSRRLRLLCLRLRMRRVPMSLMPWRLSPQRSIMPMASISRRRRSASSLNCVRMDSVTCPSVLPRRSIALATTPRSSVPPRASASRCVNSRFPPEPTLWLLSPAAF